MWVDGGFTQASPLDPNHGNFPSIVERTHTYDRASNRLTNFNDNPTLTQWVDRDRDYNYDGLHRLKTHRTGQINQATPSFSIGKQWNLDLLGNWTAADYDADANGTFGDPGDTTETQVHNAANEQSQRDNYDRWGTLQTATPHVFDYDDAGNKKNTVRSDTGAEKGGGKGDRLLYCNDCSFCLRKVACPAL